MTTPPRWQRLFGLTGVIAAFLAPIVATFYPLSVYNRKMEGDYFAMCPALEKVRVAYGGALTWSDTYTVQKAYGSTIGFILLAWTLTMIAFWIRHRRAWTLLEKIAFASAMAGHLVSLAGNILDYWHVAGRTGPYQALGWFITKQSWEYLIFGWAVVAIGALRLRLGRKRGPIVLLFGLPGVPALYLTYWIGPLYFPDAKGVYLGLPLAIFFVLAGAAWGLIGWDLFRRQPALRAAP